MMRDSLWMPEEPLWQALRRAHRVDEAECVGRLLNEIQNDPAQNYPAQAARILADAVGLIEVARQKQDSADGMEAMLHAYALSSQEGIVLMCLAEALLRIPDSSTADMLIADKIGAADWATQLGKSGSAFVNASTFALMLTGKIVGLEEDGDKLWRRLVSRLGEPVIRVAIRTAMRGLGQQFVMGQTIAEALIRAGKKDRIYRHSFDMLGEAARTRADADRYNDAYHQAIQAIGMAAAGRGIHDSPSISIKLSALHPRYDMRQREQVLRDLPQRLLALAQQAKQFDIGLTVDAEEADRLDLSLEVMRKVWSDASLKGWDGFGLAVQAYQKRARPLVDFLVNEADSIGRRLMVRLVKGAYWDSEIKRAQESGLSDYPVFTRKTHTDVSYLACAHALLAASRQIYPAFATHNAQTIAAIHAAAGGRKDYEFQRLHGMGSELYDQIIGDTGWGVACRVYAPVGSHEDLLPYLVRRLLENGANTSFVNRISDAAMPATMLARSPQEAVLEKGVGRNTHIPLPVNLYGAERRNSAGLDFGDATEIAALATAMAVPLDAVYDSAPIIGGKIIRGSVENRFEPSEIARHLGKVVWADAQNLADALQLADAAQAKWSAQSVEERAACLNRVADLLAADTPALLALLQREGGKILPDAIAELREAIDFCRYYAHQATESLSPRILNGITGESNILTTAGRGVFACISPWNFPLAIFIGQIVAALVAGNAVLAKPAEQTPLIGFRVVQILHKAGIPVDILHYLPADGRLGAAMVADRRVAGVAFTGSTEVARKINRSLAERDAPIAILVAETGGLNAMIVDSSALLEQVTQDALNSAFLSAGQRCSAARILYVQAEIADKLIAMLSGAMAELVIGNPRDLASDIGAVIDEDARKMLEHHVVAIEKAGGKLLAKTPMPAGLNGFYVAPHLFELPDASLYPREVFGPMLHLVRWKAGTLDKVIAAINQSGYGLTLGIHSRIDHVIDQVRRNAKVGNLYVNRSIVGAVVGVQPFGGEGYSGTGPKAGGPHYLTRFCVERAVSINTTASGGNTALLSSAEG